MTSGRPSGAAVWVFLSSGCFRPTEAFERVGLSWISLDSLVRIVTRQWVARREAGIQSFVAFWPSRAKRRNGGPQLWRGKRRNWNGGQNKLASDFLQGFVGPMSVADDMSGLGSARTVR